MSTTSKSSEFGYYPFPIDIKDDRFSVETLPDLDRAIESVKNHKNVFGSWIHSGPRLHQVSSDVVAELPYPQRIFGLPKTHRLTIHNDDENAIPFVIWCMSFFLGMRLTTTEAGYLDGTPIEPGRLTDFVIQGDSSQIIRLALNIICQEGTDSAVPARLAAVIHALFLSEYHQYLPFEKFHYAYVALDGCYRIQAQKAALKTDISHGERIKWLCKQFSFPVPNWANPKSPTRIARERNSAVHEALFFGEPLGFKIFGGKQWAPVGNVIDQMQALICRLLVALFGFGHSAYARSPATSRQDQLLNLA